MSWFINNPQLRKQYQSKNYCIFDYDNDSDVVAIYFSSNAIYYPDTEAQFNKTIAEEDRYEWKHYKIKNVKKEIYLRDIYKSNYLLGINETYNSIDKLATFLWGQISEGDRVITVGSSSGGYAAVILGAMLGAYCVFNFGGQNNLIPNNDDVPIWKSREGIDYDKCRKYLVVDEFLGSLDYFPDIFYFYAGNNEGDLENSRCVSENPKWHKVAFNTSIHAETVYKFNYPVILGMNKEVLINKCNKLQEMKVSRLFFSIYVCGVYFTIHGIINNIVKRVIKCFRANYN